MRIVMLSKNDYTGSGWRIVEAVRRYSDHEITHVRMKAGIRNYHTQYDLNDKTKVVIQKLVDEADIIHFKGDEPPVRNWFGIQISERAKIIITVGGSFFRKDIGKPDISLANYPVERYVEGADIRTALTPDLNYPEYKGIFTPHPIDSESQLNCWTESKLPVVMFFRGERDKKGVLSRTLPAISKLRNMGLKFEVVENHGVSYEESVRMKKKATVFIDQIKIGWYGNSALEAMQFGIPVIAYISEQALEQARDDKFRSMPVLNPGDTVDGLVDLLKKIIEGKVDLKQCSNQSKRYCDETHSYRVIGKMWDRIYKGLVCERN